MSSSAEATRKLVTDFRALVTDVEELTRATATQTGEKIVDLRTRVQESVAAVKPRLEQAEALVKDKATKTDQYVHANPWAAAGLAAGIGLIVGMLVRRP
jgi:ElaB/YqjD/DUF883 family membrane-anchored ribosome-binding protein